MAGIRHGTGASLARICGTEPRKALLALALGILMLMFALNTGGAHAAPVTPGYHFDFKWGSGGSADGQFDSPYGITTDSAGNVYVADSLNNRIQKFT